MNEEKAQETVDILIDKIEWSKCVTEMLIKSPLKMLEYLRDGMLEFTGTPEMKALVEDLIKHFEKLESEKPQNEDSQQLFENLGEAFTSILRQNISNDIWLLVLRSFLMSILSRKFSPLDPDFMQTLRSDHKLTTKKLIEMFSQNFQSNMFLDEPEEEKPGRETFTDWEKVVFLSHYERFLIVIKNARKDFLSLIKIIGRQKAQQEVIEKYQIPQELSKPLFEYVKKPKYSNVDSRLALEWAKIIVGSNAKNSSLERNILYPARKVLTELLGRKKSDHVKLISAVGNHKPDSVIVCMLSASSKNGTEFLKFNKYESRHENKEGFALYFINTKLKPVTSCRYLYAKSFFECEECRNVG